MTTTICFYSIHTSGTQTWHYTPTDAINHHLASLGQNWVGIVVLSIHVKRYETITEHQRVKVERYINSDIQQLDNVTDSKLISTKVTVLG